MPRKPKAHEYRYELAFRDRGASRTGDNSVTFQSNDPQKMLVEILPLVKSAFEGFAKKEG